MSYKDASWQANYSSLLAFRKKNPERWPEAKARAASEKKLASWCSYQRTSRRNGKLEFGRILLLDEILFPWAPGLTSWNDQFVHLVEFRSEWTDRWPKAKEEYPHGNRLGTWCDIQRRLFRSGDLESERSKLLTDIGFPWFVVESKWQVQFDYLVEYRKENPQTWPMGREEFPAGNKLASWCAFQRKANSSNGLDDTKKQKLEGIGFPWEKPADELWLRQYRALVAFRRMFPDRWPRVEETFPEDNPLGSWCNSQRRAFASGVLSETRTSMLNEVAFPWAIRRGPKT